jgi:hypothetical protein
MEILNNKMVNKNYMKKFTRLFALIAASFLFAFKVNAQNTSLKTQCVGAGDESLSQMTTDAAGNVFYAGNFSDTVSASGVIVSPYFDMSPPTFEYAFLAKHDNNGGSNWAIPIGGPDILFARVDDLETDASGNLFLVLTSVIFADSLHIGDVLSIPAPGGPSTTIMLKMDTQGNLLWSKIFTGIINGADVAIDAQGGFFLTGYHSNAIVLDTLTINPATSNNGNFIAKGDANGNMLWGKSFSGSIGMNQFPNNAINAQNELFMSGAWEGDTLLIDALQVVNPVPGAGNFDRFIAKFDANGTAIWLKREGGIAPNGSAQLQVTSSGGVLAFSNLDVGASVDIDGGGTNIQGPVSLFTRYSNQGALSWHQTIAFSPGVFPRNFTGDGTNYYLAYNFSAPQITLGSTTFTNMGGSNGTNDIAIATLDSSVNILSALHIGTAEGDFNLTMAYTNTNELLVGGITAGSQLVLGNDTLKNRGLLTTEVFIASVSNSIGIREEKTLKPLSVYPNPTADFLNFQLEGTPSENVQITIQNTIGQTLVQQTFTTANGPIRINVNSLKTGVYLLNIVEGSNRYAARFIKE